jgi:hypothetical protein
MSNAIRKINDFKADLEEAGFNVEFPNYHNADLLVTSDVSDFSVVIRSVPKSYFGARTDVAIHVLEPNFTELLDCMESAAAKGFELIVVYQ